MTDVHFTIITVLFNSKKWIHNYIRSILNSSYDKSLIDLVLVDNARKSGDAQKLTSFQRELNRLNRYTYLPLEKNLGFGRANNIGSKKAQTEILFFLNIDTELHQDCLSVLADAIRNSSEKIGVGECRRFPYEHPKYYDPRNMECTWSSGACFAVPKKIFSAAGGFDRFIHMCCEDVELSWKLRLKGYRCKYVPKAVVHHYAYQYPGETKSVQLYHSLKNVIYLRFRYGRVTDILKGFLLLFFGFVRRNYGRWNVLRIMLSCPLFFMRSLKFRLDNREAIKRTKFEFHGTDFALHRKGAFYFHKEYRQTGPLVSVIMRTVDRPDALREAMMSVVHQTYENVEIIVVQDGKRDERNEAVIKAFDTDRIKYIPTGEKVGRCRAGNIGLANAAGEYINFLDDDDLFFADHLETLMSAVMEGEADSAYSLSFVTPQIITEKPYKYKIMNLLHGIDVAHNPHSLLYFNQFPIQSVLFSKRLYEKYGGFDENLTYLEDWDLWLRYSQDWCIKFVEKTTSLFRVPGDDKGAKERSDKLEAYHETLYRKYYDQTFNVTGRDLIEMSSHLFKIFPLKMMRNDIDNMDTSMVRHCLYLSERDPVFNNCLKVVVMKAFEKISMRRRKG